MEITQEELDLIKEGLAYRIKHTGGGMARYCWLREDKGEVTQNGNTACHAELRGDTNRKFKLIGGLVNKTYGNFNENNSLKFYDWLLNRSPYSPIFITKDAKEAHEEGFIARTDYHHNLVGSAFLASRATYEGSVAANWSAFVDVGCNEDLAFILAHSFKVGTGRYLYKTSASHTAMHGNCMYLSGMANFVNHKVPEGPTYYDNSSYHSMDYMWNDKNAHLAGIISIIVRDMNLRQIRVVEEKQINPFIPKLAQLNGGKAIPLKEGCISATNQFINLLGRYVDLKPIAIKEAA